jgi:hypothetical protein
VEKDELDVKRNQTSWYGFRSVCNYGNNNAGSSEVKNEGKDVSV